MNKVDFIKGTVLSRSTWEHVIQDQDVIVHLAAETGTGQSMYNIEQYTNVNIQGTALMLDVLANTPHHVQKVILASSRAIYGEGKYLSKELGIVYPTHRRDVDMQNGDFEVKYPGSGPLTPIATDEGSKQHPSSVYGITKHVQEQLVINVCPSLGIYGIIFRYQNVFGPGQSLTNPYTGIFSIFSTRIRNGQSINIFEDGKESRDFVYIDDVVTSTIAGIEKDLRQWMIINVGSGKSTSVLTVAQTLMEQMGIEVPLEISGRFRVGDIRHNYADVDRLYKYLGVCAQVEFSKGVHQFVKWVKGQPPAEDRYDRSLEEMKQKGTLK